MAASQEKLPSSVEQTSRMPLIEALQILQQWRQQQIVVTTMGSAREWPKLSDHALDFHYIPSAMGEAPALGLGMALARPDKEVVVLNGDGCMLMNLGCLVTIASSGAKNLTLIVLDNGIYEVTGGQQLASKQARADFTQLAQGAGWSSVFSFDDLQPWKAEIEKVMTAPGPRFIVLSTHPVGEHYHLESPGPMADRIAGFREALNQDRAPA